MSSPAHASTLGTKLRIQQETLGVDDAALLGTAVDKATLEALRRGELTAGNVEGVSQIAGVLGVSTGDLLPDPLDPADLEPTFAGMKRKELQEHHERAVAASLAKVMRAKGLPVHALRRGEERAREPDAVITVSILGKPQKVGIEVTCVGYFERGSADAGAYARELWDAASGERRQRTSSEGAAAAEDDGIELGPMLTNFDDVRRYAQELLEAEVRKDLQRADDPGHRCRHAACPAHASGGGLRDRPRPDDARRLSVRARVRAHDLELQRRDRVLHPLVD